MLATSQSTFGPGNGLTLGNFSLKYRTVYVSEKQVPTPHNLRLICRTLSSYHKSDHMLALRKRPSRSRLQADHPPSLRQTWIVGRRRKPDSECFGGAEHSCFVACMEQHQPPRLPIEFATVHGLRCFSVRVPFRASGPPTRSRLVSYL